MRDRSNASRIKDLCHGLTTKCLLNLAATLNVAGSSKEMCLQLFLEGLDHHPGALLPNHCTTMITDTVETTMIPNHERGMTIGGNHGRATDNPITETDSQTLTTGIRIQIGLDIQKSTSALFLTVRTPTMVTIKTETAILMEISIKEVPIILPGTMTEMNATAVPISKVSNGILLAVTCHQIVILLAATIIITAIIIVMVILKTTTTTILITITTIAIEVEALLHLTTLTSMKTRHSTPGLEEGSIRTMTTMVLLWTEDTRMTNNDEWRIIIA